jgi:hypothetical protein
MYNVSKILATIFVMGLLISCPFFIVSLLFPPALIVAAGIACIGVISGILGMLTILLECLWEN